MRHCEKCGDIGDLVGCDDGVTRCLACAEDDGFDPENGEVLDGD